MFIYADNPYEDAIFTEVAHTVHSTKKGVQTVCYREVASIHKYYNGKSNVMELILTFTNAETRTINKY